MIIKKNCYKFEFCDFVLRNFDYNLASSFSSKVVLLGKMKRLAQRNKIKLITILFLEDLVQFSSISSAKAASVSPAN